MATAPPRSHPATSIGLTSSTRFDSTPLKSMCARRDPLMITRGIQDAGCGMRDAESAIPHSALPRLASRIPHPTPPYNRPFMHRQPIVVFTDGAAKGNPGPGGWGAIIVTPEGDVTELGGRADGTTTNNRMELTAAIEALSALRAVPGALAIYTDSTYVIQGIRAWIFGWRKRGWKTAAGADVLNRDLWEQLDALVSARGKGGIEWHYVKGHAGTPGNERVDEIADGLARGEAVTLYRGSLLAYEHAILDLPSDTDVPA